MSKMPDILKKFTSGDKLESLGISVENSLDWDYINKTIFNKSLTYRVENSYARSDVFFDSNQIRGKFQDFVSKMWKIDEKFSKIWQLSLYTNDFDIIQDFDYSNHELPIELKMKDVRDLRVKSLIVSTQRYLYFTKPDDIRTERLNIILRLFTQITEQEFDLFRRYLENFRYINADSFTKVPLNPLFKDSLRVYDNIFSFDDNSGSLYCFELTYGENREELEKSILRWLTKLIKRSGHLTKKYRILNILNPLTNIRYVVNIQPLIEITTRGLSGDSLLVFDWCNLVLENN